MSDAHGAAGTPPPAGDDNLKSQREKFDAYRNWMKQQQQTLETTGAATAEMARRMEGDDNNHNHRNANDHMAQESAYMRRHSANRRAGSPNAQQQQQHHHGSGSPTNAHNRDARSPPSPYDRDGNVIYSQPRSGERPPWMNTKVGSSNHKSQIPPEQLAKFMPPPPPSDDGSGYSNDPLNVYSRSQLWQRRKAQKMAEAREIKEQVMDMECTFAPQTHTAEFFSGSRSAEDRGQSTASNTARGETGAGGAGGAPVSVARSAGSLGDSSRYGGGFHVTGVEDYLQRQERAKQEKDFKESRLKTKPQYQWRNETTICEPFELGRKRPTHIKSLKQPFTAAPGAVQQAMRQSNIPPANDLFAPLAGVLPRGVFSGVTAAEIVDSAVLRSGGEPSPAAGRR